MNMLKPLHPSLFALLVFSNFIFCSPPKSIPKDKFKEFTLNGKIPVESQYFDNTYSSDQPLVYDFNTIETMKRRIHLRESNHYAGTDPFVYAAIEKYHAHIKGKKVAIMGSIVPWYEAFVLAYGGNPVTIEYNKIISKHPDLRTLTVAEYEANPELFDAVISISSYEHDGLGRYGDPINPIGDLIAMEKTKKMLNPGGVLFLAVPIGYDRLVWNAHRIYGKKRLPLLLSGWKTLDTFGFHINDLKQKIEEQPVFVLQVE